MIKLFEDSEKEFKTLGLGVLKDALECGVTEKLNDEFELEMLYPIDGAKYNELRIGRILYCKANPYDNEQPFRIYSITKPLKGKVTISAHHISYDMNGLPCKAVCKYDENGKSTDKPAEGLNEALGIIQNGSYIKHPFILNTNISSGKTFKTTQPYNMRALIMGDEKESLIGVYDAELKFDRYMVNLLTKRGKNRGAQVCYGYNMTDLRHQVTTDLLFNGVFPYYHKEKTSTKTANEDKFTQAYIVGSKPFQDGWLSYTKDGEAYHPVDGTPVQIATEGDYYQKVFSWDGTYQKYVERVYNQSVTLIEGVTAPEWITIDWSKFPVIACRANKNGYFKSAIDTSWSDKKGVGDLIFDGNILKEGLTGMASNMIIYYSEVIPSEVNSTNTEVKEIVDVVLDDPIIKINTSDAISMKYDNILSLDLTSEFDEEPTQEKLRIKAEEYISKNKLGTVKHSTEVSFIDLAMTTDKDKYKNFEHVELGDTVRVIYRDLGVDVELRVISTEYDVLSGMYEKVELGEKKDNMSSTTIQNGDSISSLTNDIGYADITTVHKLIADTITAEYLQAVNAKLSKAQIEDLEVAQINCKGILQASQLTLDELVAKMLVADNAKIAQTLEAGNIKVAGDVSIRSGSIHISNDEDGSDVTFNVDRDGNVESNSMHITGGNLDIGGNFEVTNDGLMTAKNAVIEGKITSKEADIEGKIVATSGEIGGCKIDEDGNLIVPAALIEGLVKAKSIIIQNGDMTVLKADSDDPNNVIVGGFKISNGSIVSINSDENNKVTISPDGINLGKKFRSTKDGHIEADDAVINGKITSKEADIEGKIVATSGKIGGLYVDEKELKYNTGSNGNGLTITEYGYGPISNTGILKGNNPGIRSDYIETVQGLILGKNIQGYEGGKNEYGSIVTTINDYPKVYIENVQYKKDPSDPPEFYAGIMSKLDITELINILGREYGTDNKNGLYRLGLLLSDKYWNKFFRMFIQNNNEDSLTEIMSDYSFLDLNKSDENYK